MSDHRAGDDVAAASTNPQGCASAFTRKEKRPASLDTVPRMSQENVEIVRRMFDAWTSGDRAGVVEAIDENAVTRPIIGPEWHGRDGFLEMAADWVEGFDQLTITADESIDAGDKVLVRVRQEGRGASTGVPVQVTFWWVYWLKNAKIVRFEMFQDREPALEAAGLLSE